jgi:chemotaxis-related protein WspB
MEHALTQRRPEDDLVGARGRPKLMLLLRADSNPYAIDACQVAEVIVSVGLTALPDAPAGVVGLVNHHGRMLPVVDLCRLTVGRDCERLLSTRIVMVRFPPDSPTGLVGLRAEHVTEGVWVDAADVTGAEGGFDDTVYLRRVIERRTEMVSVVCLERLLPDGLRRRLASHRSQEV